MSNVPLPHQGNPMSIPLPPHVHLNYESSEASSIVAVTQPLSAEVPALSSGQPMFNGDPLCNICDELVDPMFAQVCGLCKLHYHLQCGDRFFVTPDYYFEMCYTCAQKCTQTKQRLHADFLETGETWNLELWLHSLARKLRTGQPLERHSNKHMHKLNKVVWTLIREGIPFGTPLFKWEITYSLERSNFVERITSATYSTVG